MAMVMTEGLAAVVFGAEVLCVCVCSSDETVLSTRRECMWHDICFWFYHRTGTTV